MSLLRSPRHCGLLVVADNRLTIFADPAKYQCSTCEGLGRQRQAWMKKEQELNS
jgi:hypothetical protein